MAQGHGKEERVKVRVIKQGDETFTYTGEDEFAIRQALLHGAGAGGFSIVYDITDIDRSDMDAGEYLIATEDDGTPVWSGWLGGVTGPPPASISGDAGPAPAQRLLELELPGNDSGATTVRGYLARLLERLWREDEGFSGKRPFGNSGWQYDVYAPMVKAGIIGGRLDGDGYIEQADTARADELILAAIAALGEPS